MLSSGGLGYFEYEATVEGDATLKLTVGLQQVDDVLKSLVVYDDKGGVGGLSLPGREPLKQAFKDLPFDESSLGSPAALLATLKGAQVSVGGGRAISGRIVSVEPETATVNDGKTTIRRTRVTLLTDRGLQQFILEDAENLQFADAALVVVDDQALQHVVDLVEADGELQRRITVDRSLIFEVTQATGREHYALQPKILRLGKHRASAKRREHHGQQPFCHESSRELHADRALGL